jgi:hypothetical protein
MQIVSILPLQEQRQQLSEFQGDEAPNVQSLCVPIPGFWPGWLDPSIAEPAQS